MQRIAHQSPPRGRRAWHTPIQQKTNDSKAKACTDRRCRISVFQTLSHTMNLKNKPIAIIGLGYVGLQLAVEF
eukprot:gene38777-62339_t